MRLALLFGLFALLVVGTLTILFREFGLLLGIFLCFWLGKGLPVHRQEAEALLVIAAFIGLLVAVLSSSAFRDIAGAYY